jgi:hypothetical protein
MGCLAFFLPETKGVSIIFQYWLDYYWLSL